MKVSEKWLREWVDPPLSVDDIAARLTMAGLEVEAVRERACEFRGVVVAVVESVAPHPESEALRLCTVNAGEASLTVVCGDPGVAAGRRYPLALPGAALAAGRTVQATEIRGAKSAGMLCSAAELGLSDEPAKLLELDDSAPPGTDLAQLLDPEDRILELSLTPNRGDWLSISGVAREVGVAVGAAVRSPAMDPVPAESERIHEVELEASVACPRYTCRIIDDVDATRPTPSWIGERLRRAGIRHVSAIVDITNYVMLELGQPLHAFDDAHLQGAVIVRFAVPGEMLETLDGIRRELASDVLVIADESGPLALAGIMGGVASGVSVATQSILLESAFFAPDSIMGRARRYGMQTDASQRFERGVDPALQVRAIERATRLITEACGGRPGPVTDVQDEQALPPPRRMSLRWQRLDLLLGMAMDRTAAGQTLERLGMAVRPSDDGIDVEIPSFRFDLALEADLIEEVARVHGYDRLPRRRLGGRLALHEGLPNRRFRTWRRLLADTGYHEAITYSFVPERIQAALFPDIDPPRLLNPIASDRAVLRCSILPGLVEALQHNLKRQRERVWLFEIGRVFQRGETLGQGYRLAALITGNRYVEQWGIKVSSCDFYDMKNHLETVLGMRPGMASPEYRRLQHPALHPGQAMEILLGNQRVGIAGALHPAVCRSLEISAEVFVFELDLDAIPAGTSPIYREIPRFPAVRRDLAIVVDRDLPAADLMAVIRESGGALLNNLELFDVYEGEGIDSGKKSLALCLTFQKSSSTLVDLEVEHVLGKILMAVRDRFGGTLRE
jgi:phenylalanyl-tRNA synthetase beta chain